MGRPVTVVPYDPRWPERYEREARRLRTVLPHARVHHIGSTSVPGLASKPVLDLLVEARTLGELDDATPALRDAGYEARGEYGIPERRYFVRRPEDGPAVHVHAFAAGHERAARHLLFRDYLRHDGTDAALYGALKRVLADRHPTDRDAYQAGKEALVAELQARALRWREARDPGGEATPEGTPAGQDEPG